MTRIALLAGCAALALSGAALANEPYLPKGERAFQRLDADGNGKITMDELKPKAAKRFLKLDDDADGIVTSAEIDTWLKARIERRKARLMGRLDGDKNGAITRVELDQFVDALFKEVDSDHDGGVSLEEARAFKVARRAAVPETGN